MTGTNADVLECLRDTCRRRVLRLLQFRGATVDVSELALHLAAERRDRPPEDVPERKRTIAHRELLHVQLPRLQRAALVTWDRQAETVRDADHPALTAPRFRAILTLASSEYDPVIGALARWRRRLVLSVLRDRAGPISRTDVAEALAREHDVDDAPSLPECPVAREGLLHHVLLPKLEDDGLVSYDRDDGTVSYAPHPALEDGPLTFLVEDPIQIGLSP